MGSKKRRLAQSQRRGKQRSSVSKLLYILVPGIVVVVVGVLVVGLLNGSSGNSGNASNLMYPPYAASLPNTVKVAYDYAVQHSDDLQYIPCFCGCGQHSGHMSVHDCFVKYGHLTGGPVAFDDHGANCDMCVNIVLDAKRLLDDGKSLQDVRQFVVNKYGKIGPGTNTPPIPF